MDTRACQPPHDHYPFCDHTLRLEDRVGDLISRIPDDAKPHLLTARGWPQGNVRNLTSELGVPAFDWGLNCIHGVQSTCKGDVCATSFPNPNSLGASWNMSNVRLMGAYIGSEARALWLQGVTETSAWSGRALVGLDCWSPNINVNRDPRQKATPSPPFPNSGQHHSQDFGWGVGGWVLAHFTRRCGQQLTQWCVSRWGRNQEVPGEGTIKLPLPHLLAGSLPPTVSCAAGPWSAAGADVNLDSQS
jgi:hypothetical protein